jgi:leader peptidase (prepilin peptidase)/N-methyltransferase
MTAFVIAAAGVFGLLIGSFLNVVAYRVPAGLSVVRPASACPGCHNEIAPRDNVPLLSWILLRGACRHCGMRISIRYPLVEAGTAAAFGIAAVPFAAQLGGVADPRAAAAATVELVAYLYLAAISVALAVIDIDVRRLPDRIVLPAYGVGLLLLGLVDALRGDLVALGTATAAPAPARRPCSTPCCGSSNRAAWGWETSSSPVSSVCSSATSGWRSSWWASPPAS